MIAVSFWLAAQRASFFFRFLHKEVGNALATRKNLWACDFKRVHEDLLIFVPGPISM